MLRYNTETGTAVKIIRVPSKYKDVLQIGDIGVVKKIFKYGYIQWVSVFVLFKMNKYCPDDGHFVLSPYYLEECEIEDIPSAYPTSSIQTLKNFDNIKNMLNARYGKGDKNMKNEQLLKGYKKAAVRFRNDTGYSDIWYAMYDDVANVDDAVLCMKPNHSEVIGTVVAIEPFENDAVDVDYGREIICKIDYSAYCDRQKKLERIAKLKTTMAKKKAELDELAVYELLASKSPEIADMLKELKELL